MSPCNFHIVGEANWRGVPTHAHSPFFVSNFHFPSLVSLSAQFSLEVKGKEKRRLDRVLREEEIKLQRAETELRLAQQAFDQFLQQNDSEAIRAQKR